MSVPSLYAMHMLALLLYVCMYVCMLGPSDYRDSIHYRDNLTLFMNKIVGCWTTRIVVL